MKITKRMALFLLVGLLTFGLGVWVSRPGTFESYCARVTPWQALLTFENQDLQGLDEQSKQKLKAAVEAVTRKRNEDGRRHFEPALFQQMLNTKGERRYVFVEEAPMQMVPDSTKIRVHVFDSSGRLLNAQEFNAGYRQSITSMQVRENLFLQTHGLVVNTGFIFTQHESRSFYVLVDNTLNLAYLELNGQFYENDYQSPHMTFGPIYPRLIDDWEKALNSTNNAEVLTALMWFSGRHWEDEPPPYDHDKLESQKLSALRSRETVRKRLLDLGQSENHWIKTAAKSVLENTK